jgi:hypothetical protein
MNIINKEDWYNVKRRDLSKRSADALLNKYGGSLPTALSNLYEQYHWESWRFTRTPPGFWKNSENQRRYLEWLTESSQLNIKYPEQWYSISLNDILSNEGSTLMDIYKDSLANALRTLYPEYEWNMWLFPNVPTNFFLDFTNQRRYLDWLEDKLSINSVEDWYDVSIQHICMFNGYPLVKNGYKSLIELLQRHYPQHYWNPKSFITTRDKTQHKLLRIVKELFKSYEIRSNEKIPDIKFPSSQTCITLDIYVPHFNLAFEYQGEHHYYFNKLYGYTNRQQERDEVKRQLCYAAGITLIEVPHWWNFDKYR